MTATAFSVWPQNLSLAPIREPARAPRPVALAFGALVVALLAGVAEALAQTALLLERSDADLGGLATGLAMRAVLYLVVLAVAIRMTHGDRWARVALTFGIGVLGLASLLVEPIRAVLSTDDIGTLFDGVTASGVGIAIFRAIHVAAVLVAIPAMYHRIARPYFRA
ncbi:hypothetical protein [Nocardia sp. XZ_19_385]|uniref:hypothetical protein n=1 Tax=Nocardia sp. XZ_19_385 TaxID=2769488 RepID=UPI00188E4B9F|nr:hypothetical protein [Nocardia sp. XZ_19_385]